MVIQSKCASGGVGGGWYGAEEIESGEELLDADVSSEKNVVLYKAYVLKLTHSPLWEDVVGLAPMWTILRDAWYECGLRKIRRPFSCLV
jgi:hypothetical protein